MKDEKKEALNRPIWYENKLKRNVDYQKENVKRIGLDLNRKTDIDVIEHLEKQPNKQGYIKELIRDDIKKGK